MQEVDAYSGQGGISMGTCQVLVQVPVLEVDANIGYLGLLQGTCGILVSAMQFVPNRQSTING